MRRIWLVVAIVACGEEGSSPAIAASCGDMLPFEATCRFEGIVSCSDAFVCKAGEYVCPEGGQRTGARVCLADCQAYVADHPECQCSGDLMFGYNINVVCP